MSQQSPTNNPSPKPPAEPLTQAERIALRQAREEAGKMFEKLLEQDHRNAESGGNVTPPTPRKSRRVSR